MYPAGAVAQLGVAHNQIGSVYHEAKQIDAALRHFRESIRYKEIQGDVFGAGQTRSNAAKALAKANRPVDALKWARSSLRDLKSVGTLTRKSSIPLSYKRYRISSPKD